MIEIGPLWQLLTVYTGYIVITNQYSTSSYLLDPHTSRNFDTLTVYIGNQVGNHPAKVSVTHHHIIRIDRTYVVSLQLLLSTICPPVLDEEAKAASAYQNNVE